MRHPQASTACLQPASHTCTNYRQAYAFPAVHAQMQVLRHLAPRHEAAHAHAVAAAPCPALTLVQWGEACLGTWRLIFWRLLLAARTSSGRQCCSNSRCVWQPLACICEHNSLASLDGQQEDEMRGGRGRLSEFESTRPPAHLPTCAAGLLETCCAALLEAACPPAGQPPWWRASRGSSGSICAHPGPHACTTAARASSQLSAAAPCGTRWAQRRRRAACGAAAADVWRAAACSLARLLDSDDARRWRPVAGSTAAFISVQPHATSDGAADGGCHPGGAAGSAASAASAAAASRAAGAACRRATTAAAAAAAAAAA